MNMNPIIGLLAIAAVFVVGVWALNQSDVALPNINVDTITDSIPSVEPKSEAVARLDAITDSPENYVGQQVTVQGEVDNVIAANALILDVPGDIRNDEILVISQNPVSESVEDAEGLLNENQVRLTGTVDTFVYALYQDRLGDDWDASLVDVYEGRPFIMTNAVSLVR